jgi:serine phosphatase RsbU (regulator of sigma subunit)
MILSQRAGGPGSVLSPGGMALGLEASIARPGHLPAARMIRRLCDDVREFTGGRPQHDDMTMVSVNVV